MAKTRSSMTPEQEALLREHYGKMPVAELAALMGRTVSCVYSNAAKFGLRARPEKPPKS